MKSLITSITTIPLFFSPSSQNVARLLLLKEPIGRLPLAGATLYVDMNTLEALF